ncbi:Uncharacterised protein [Citrobacter koseri]|uniref:Uncharacterized protein n=1 Tax=Citrobacter koseri TaxID=545 RepID=A0A447UGK3_CITKO|nr:Uncharacterised protein [Citrobacter koseri]
MRTGFFILCGAQRAATLSTDLLFVASKPLEKHGNEKK